MAQLQQCSAEFRLQPIVLIVARGNTERSLKCNISYKNCAKNIIKIAEQGKPGTGNLVT